MVLKLKVTTGSTYRPISSLKHVIGLHMIQDCKYALGGLFGEQLHKLFRATRRRHGWLVFGQRRFHGSQAKSYNWINLPPYQFAQTRHWIAYDPNAFAPLPEDLRTSGPQIASSL
jgi:hypothetical protein